MQRWLLTYSSSEKASTASTRIVWSEFREVLPSGGLAFYNMKADLFAPPPGRQVHEHLYVVAPGHWLDVITMESGDTREASLPTIGRPPSEVRRRQRQARPN
jgi:hypothetical protein